MTFLDVIGDRARVRLLDAGWCRPYRSGELLMREGDASASAMVLLDGRVKVVKTVPSGRHVLLELRGPGSLLGEVGVIDGRPRSATVAALTDGRAVHVTAERFRELIEQEPELAVAVLHTVVARLRASADRQLELGADDAMQRVCRRLLELAALFGRKGHDGTVVVESPVSQQELADWAGLSRDGVVRALGALRRDGLVQTSRRRFVIADLESVLGRASWPA